MKRKILILILLGLFFTACDNNSNVNNIDKNNDKNNDKIKEEENYSKEDKNEINDSNYIGWIQIKENQEILVGVDIDPGTYDIKCADGENSYDFNVFENQKALDDFNNSLNDSNIDWLDHFNNYYVLKDDKNKSLNGIELKDGNVIDVMLGGIALKNVNSIDNNVESDQEITEESKDNYFNEEKELKDDLNSLNKWKLDVGDTTSSGAQKILPDIYKKIESMQTKMQGYIDNPKTYTFKANVDIINDYSELLGMYDKLANETISYDEYLNLIDAQNKMILTQIDLPEIYND